MTQTLFKVIKERHSQAIIDVLAPEWGRPLLERMPEVSGIHDMPIGHGVLALKKRYEIAKNLRTYFYSHSIVLPNSWKSALIPWWANIPKRTGFLGEYRFGLLNDIRVLNKKQLPRMIDRIAELGYEKGVAVRQPIPYPRLTVDGASIKSTLAIFNLTNQVREPILALSPGAEFGPSKRWPENYYAELAVEKQKQGWSIWLFGSKKDQGVAEKIQERTQGKCNNFTGKTTLSQAVDLLSLTQMVVSNDSGLMHIAAALQKPLIALYGSTDPTFTPPLTEKAKIVQLSLPCRPCFARECPLQHHHCMQHLYPTYVLTAVQSMEVSCES